MLPTPRLFLLLLLAAPLVAGAAIARPLLWLALAYLIVVAGVLISDLLLTPVPGQIEVERINDARLSLGAENLVTVLISNASPRALRFTMRDESPDEMPSDAAFISGDLPAYDVFSAQYRLRPLRRGDYQFGDVVLRYRGLLGTFVRQARYPTAAPVQVYPNVLELRKYDLLAHKGLLYEQGLRPARVYGQGGEFARLREYGPDDEYRRVSWKATARRGRPIVAEVETERSQHVICMIDTGRLMAPPLGEIAKLDYVINTALLLSYVAALKGDHVGLLTFADQVGAFLAPQRGKAQFQRMIEALYNVHAEAVEADHAVALGYLQRRVRRRSLVVLFTDLATPDAARPLIAYLARLSRQHLIVCVTISDPNVSAAVGAPARDLTAAYTRAVAEQLRDERQAILDTLSRSGVIPVDVPADKLTISVVNTYLRLKAQGRL
ncbi:DUF58 domain-containing protein [Oscillochloris sp. ZM17-4]|uniref:DUF58 domain-containing protein n=1 Tax=Oscillochloris sp. ZM17-4 TaxID=2866714 RepID=UPI001C73DAAB|nr:DUF58 domain-containing protein [Oscillochloris sp. ZM17-4]MBX0326425.1 DUF58 domain-containing protein [Oscillochloris sp. ZM17-4]